MVVGMELPKDPIMLYSFLNLKLRDFYSSLDALCDDLEINRAVLEQTLCAAGFIYDEKNNRFV